MLKREELAPRQVAQLLGLRLDGVYSLIWAGKLEAHKLDGRWRIPAQAVQDRLQARERNHATAGR